MVNSVASPISFTVVFHFPFSLLLNSKAEKNQEHHHTDQAEETLLMITEGAAHVKAMWLEACTSKTDNAHHLHSALQTSTKLNTMYSQNLTKAGYTASSSPFPHHLWCDYVE